MRKKIVSRFSLSTRSPGFRKSQGYFDATNGKQPISGEIYYLDGYCKGMREIEYKEIENKNSTYGNYGKRK